MTDITLADFCAAANELWPEHTAESWDRVGLVSGRSHHPVRRVLLAVDAVQRTVTEAREWGADVLFTHHPLLLRGVSTISTHTSKGDLLTTLIESQCALYAAHTNADAPPGGVSAVLADAFGLRNAVPINAGHHEGSGIGRVGDLANPVPLREFAARVAEALPPTTSGVRVAGDPERLVQRVALCGGAGDSLLGEAAVLNSDVFVTSDLRHHPAQESTEQSQISGGPALIDVSHWASESLWLGTAARELQQRFPTIEFRVSELNTDPWSFTVS